jgi:hypothetical protein
MRFKEIPEDPLYFGIELEEFVPMNWVVSQLQKTTVAMLRNVVGKDLYHSKGDDPQKVKGELERPAFTMPLWAFDQFIVSEPGEEPDLTKDLEPYGVKRTDGVKEYIQAINDLKANFSTHKVYTFCFWGISRFLDNIKWEIVGVVPGRPIDFNQFCGKPPVYACIYSLKDDPSDPRHLQSKKKYLFNLAFWSSLNPPSVDKVSGLLGSHNTTFSLTDQDSNANTEKKKKRGVLKKKIKAILECCTVRTGR